MTAPMSTDEPLLRWFAYAHLPTDLQEASRPFCELAESVVGRHEARQP
jgi:hypothetical protein